MSFKGYLKEQEDLAIVAHEQSKKQKIANFFRSVENTNDDAFREFATTELGMDPIEAQNVKYSMLQDYVSNSPLYNDLSDEEAGGMPDELGGGSIEISMDGDGIDTDEELPMEPEEGDIEAEDEPEEDEEAEDEPEEVDEIKDIRLQP